MCKICQQHKIELILREIMHKFSMSAVSDHDENTTTVIIIHT